MNVNKVHILGRITGAIEIKALPSGQSVCSFSIATNRYWKDKDGNKQEQVEFHNMVAFGKTAEILQQYTGKGALLYAEGRLVTRNWEADGKKFYKTEIHIESFQLPPKSMSGEAGGSAPQQQQAQGSNAPDYPAEEINPEDIPF
tara:strand:+ start:719 stop:1150 length:432 start_codon:yes stop_codon:yes gene_type:complete